MLENLSNKEGVPRDNSGVCQCPIHKEILGDSMVEPPVMPEVLVLAT